MEDSTKPAVPPARRCCIGFFFFGGGLVVVVSFVRVFVFCLLLSSFDVAIRMPFGSVLFAD